MSATPRPFHPGAIPGLRGIVFDFDGTLADSVSIKSDSYYRVFPESAHYRAIIGQILAQHPHWARFEVIPEVLRQAGEDPSAEKSAELVAAYTAMVDSSVILCPAMPAAEEILQFLHPRLPLYLSSLTPLESIRSVVLGRNWAAYFRQIFGAPQNKADTLRQVGAELRCQSEALLVVGDSSSDSSSAAETGAWYFDAASPGSLRALLGWFQTL